MLETQISLSERERDALIEIAQRTGKSERELIQEAIAQFIKNEQRADRRALMQKAKGIWADREDIPAIEAIRQEWDRF